MTRKRKLRQMRRPAGVIPAAVSGPNKIWTLLYLMPSIQDLREMGATVGFTNGCFDVLHFGHHAALDQARQRCDFLVVGLNSDESVRRLKGPTRPIQPVTTRATMLSRLPEVGAVVVFAEDTALLLVNTIKPQVYFKGREYEAAETPETAAVKAYGGRVLYTELVPGFSTTAVVEG